MKNISFADHMFIWLVLFNATFNNISVISWQSVFLASGVTGENHCYSYEDVKERPWNKIKSTWGRLWIARSDRMSDLEKYIKKCKIVGFAIKSQMQCIVDYKFKQLINLNEPISQFINKIYIYVEFNGNLD